MSRIYTLHPSPVLFLRPFLRFSAFPSHLLGKETNATISGTLETDRHKERVEK